jgi:hypothetical protein
MTLFGLYRVVEIPGKVKLSTITDPITVDLNPVIPAFADFAERFWHMLKGQFATDNSVTDALWPEEGEGSLQFLYGKMRAKPFLIFKSGPSARGGNVPGSPQNTSPAAVVAAAYVWTRHELYPYLKDWCSLTGNTWVINRIEELTRQAFDPIEGGRGTKDGPDTPFEGVESLGKLGFKVEPAGKIRVFAMVDAWTQWLMSPLHEAIFRLLRNIPQDGTFDQLRPLGRLMGGDKPLFSFDLSAATDRLPLVLQKILLSKILTPWGAELWGILLTGRLYTHGSLKKKTHGVDLPAGGVKYEVGQPMGALSSWAMLALTHHALVQCSAFLAGKGNQWFSDYAVLGDDIVIADQEVANAYLQLLRAIGVEVGLHKSLVSKRGTALEFAKRTFYKGTDVSMLPISEFIAAVGNLGALGEYVRKYSLTLGQVFTCLGYGYKTKGAISKRLHKMQPRMANYLVELFGPSGPYFKGLPSWLAMKSVTSTFKSVSMDISGILKHILETESNLLLERLDALQPLLAKAKELGTVYRDREFYGTIKREAPEHPRQLAWKEILQSLRVASEWALLITFRGNVREVSTYGLSPQYSPYCLDLLNEMLYRTAFLDIFIEARDLRTSIEELTVDPAQASSEAMWDQLCTLWESLNKIEDSLSNMPLPRNLHTRISTRKGLVRSKDLRRWARYSSLFRKTKFTTIVGLELKENRVDSTQPL